VSKENGGGDSGSTSPVPETEDTHKYVENVMSKNARSDIFSQEKCFQLSQKFMINQF
jgi:hypothetical protein